MARLIRISILPALLAQLAMAGPARAADIHQVMVEYQANAVAFKANYFGKTISVTGPIAAINGTYISLGDARLFTVNCMVANPAQILSLSTGQQVTVTGTVSNMLAGTGVGLNPCSVQ